MSDEDSSKGRSEGLAQVAASALQVAQPLPTFIAIPSNDGIDLAQIWATLRENAALIIGTGVLVFCTVMAFTLASHMVFKSSGRLYLGEVGAPANPELDLSGGDQSDVASEIEILRSQSMVERAIVASGLNVELTPRGWTPPRFWRWLLDGRDPTLLDVAATQVLARDSELAPGALDAQAFALEFTSETDYELSSEGAEPIKGKLGETLALPSLKLKLMPGSSTEERTGAEFDLVVMPLADIIDEQQNSLLVSTPKSSSGAGPAKVVMLEFWNGSPLLSAAFLQALMDGYVRARQSWKTEEATAAEAFVTTQLHGMQQSLDATQDKLAEFRRENHGVVLESEGAAMVQQIGKYEEQRVAARLEVAALRDIKSALKRPNAPLEAYMFGEANDTVLQGLARSLSESQQRLTELESQFESAAPNVKQYRAQVDGQRKSISSYVSSRLSRAEENLQTMSSVIGGFEAKLKTVPGAELGLAQIARESEVYSKMYSFLLERQQQAAIAKASTLSKNRILDLPRVPGREDSPLLPLRLASGLFGLLLGAALVVLRSLLSGTLRSEQEARALLGPVPVFASMPKHAQGRSRMTGRRKPLYDVTAADADFGFTEALRTLRTNLYRRLPQSAGNVILVTSPSPGDGKTTCVLSLAAMLAADAKQVLVIDADVRKPTHHLLTGLPQEPGLQGLLAGKGEVDDLSDEQSGSSRLVTWRDVVHTADLSFGRFHSISAGVGARADLLSRRSLARLLDRARERYDFILLDSPSYPLVSDPLILAPLSDFVLSVVRLGNTPRKLAARHLQGLTSVARGHAAVINDAERASQYGYYPSARVHAAATGHQIAVIDAERDQLP